MNEHSEQTQTPTEYIPPTLVEVGEFTEDTLGSSGRSPDWFFNYNW
ncbi:lasso RiPP family leader peptide-containing protein [Streptomyces sp. NPDC026206]